VTFVPPELWPIVCRLATSGDWPPRGDADLAVFFEFANHQRLLPLLMADDDLPSEVIAAKARFRALDALSRRRYELSRAGVLELQRVLGADAFMFYKGSDYRHRIYDSPEQRPMADVDVYLPSAQLSTALKKLEDAGYPRKYVDFAGFWPWHYEVSVVVADVHVELHRGFSQRVRAAIDYDGIWQRREWFERDGVSGYRLSPADALLAHAFGLAKDEFTPELNRYLDFFLMLRRYEAELDTCVQRAKVWQIERPFFSALHLTSTMFPVANTAAVRRAMDGLLDPPTRKFLVEQILPDPTVELSGWSSGRRIQLRRKFALMDRHWRKVAFLTYSVVAAAVGRIFEWRARRSGARLPPRSMVRSHNRFRA
jgi:hypothetical protein